jgi:hypothetical protein
MMSSGVSWASGSLAARDEMSITARGAIKRSIGINSAVRPSATKWAGASMWVPVCSLKVSLTE